RHIIEECHCWQDPEIHHLDEEDKKKTKKYCGDQCEFEPVWKTTIPQTHPVFHILPPSGCIAPVSATLRLYKSRGPSQRLIRCYIPAHVAGTISLVSSP